MSRREESVRQIWMVSREYGKLAGAGGIKDVVSQLAVTLARWSGRSVHVVLPRYGFMEPEELGFQLLPDPLYPEKELSFEVDLNYTNEERRERVRVWTASQGRVTLYLLGAERFREKQGVYTYTAKEEALHPWQKKGEGHLDYFAMNVLLQKGALDLMVLLGYRPDVIHCHDGHTAILPALLAEHPGLRHYFRNTGSVVTIHNGGKGYHQEVADLAFALASTGLPRQVIMKSRLDECFDPFLAGAATAVMNTVSENYARELQETGDDRLTGWLGHTLLERGVLLEGITNGIDPDEFSPVKHEKSGIAAAFDPLGLSSLAGKQICKRALLQLVTEGGKVAGVRRSGYLDSNLSTPLVTFIGRLSEQKGVNVLIGALKHLLAKEVDFRFLLLGTGSQQDEELLVRLAEKKENKGKICILRGFDPALANKIYAAGDFFLIPSQYEPCGLTDFMAQLFGNLPIVHYVGGLVKVVDGKTGFTYQEQSVSALCQAIGQALRLYSADPGAIRKMQRQAVQLILERYTWGAVSKEYLKLYKKAKTQRLGMRSAGLESAR
ncbi:MAG: glycogen/starch synthase [Proteobacteria bacterium]|nr:glycogen/starch synthase [Pseudomonadota bacterium]MBU1140145.1 glycogen/starch synthase [Pseudomonadota bacterium]